MSAPEFNFLRNSFVFSNPLLAGTDDYLAVSKHLLAEEKAIVLAALRRIEQDAAGYSFAGSPLSPHPEITGNAQPGFSRPRWLFQRYKCNQFVGDVLYEAGLKMPTFTMPDGSLHYMNAERLPRQESYFKTLTNPFQIRPGDLIVSNNLAVNGENGAHVEIVVSIEEPGRYVTAGALKQGATLRSYPANLHQLPYDRTRRGWITGDNRSVHLLRPKRKLQGP
jgi:hypothetical protein